MPKKSSKQYPAAILEEAKLAVCRYYLALHAEWMLELQMHPTDWDRLFFLHYKIADLDRRAPWLRKTA